MRKSKFTEEQMAYALKQAEVGISVKELRPVRQVTQEELADHVGVFGTYMSRIKTGMANPTLTMVYALADALDVPVATLFDAPTSAVATKTRSVEKASRGRVSKN